jgi:hypothetical protein
MVGYAEEALERIGDGENEKMIKLVAMVVLKTI